MDTRQTRLQELEQLIRAKVQFDQLVATFYFAALSKSAKNTPDENNLEGGSPYRKEINRIVSKKWPEKEIPAEVISRIYDFYSPSLDAFTSVINGDDMKPLKSLAYSFSLTTDELSWENFKTFLKTKELQF